MLLVSSTSDLSHKKCCLLESVAGRHNTLPTSVHSLALTAAGADEGAAASAAQPMNGAGVSKGLPAGITALEPVAAALADAADAAARGAALAERCEQALPQARATYIASAMQALLTLEHY